MESGRNTISLLFPSNEISSFHNVNFPYPLPLIDIYCTNSQGAKSTFTSGNEGCSVERYNRLIEEHGNGTENVEFITYLRQGKNNKIRTAGRGHRWHQKKGPYTNKDGWTCREYTLSHTAKPCQKHGFTFHLLELTYPPPLSQEVAYCTMMRKRTRSTISPAVVPSGDVNSSLSGISSFPGDHFNGSTSILSGAPMAADSTPRMPIMHPGDVNYSSLSDATSSFNYDHHFLDSGAYMSTENNSFPASMPSDCPIPLDAAGGNIWPLLVDGRLGIDYFSVHPDGSCSGESYCAVGEGSIPLMYSNHSANCMELTREYSTHQCHHTISGSEAAPGVFGAPQPMEPMSHDNGYNDFGISGTANETSQHDFGMPYMEPTGTGFGTSEYTLPNESGDHNWGTHGYPDGWISR